MSHDVLTDPLLDSPTIELPCQTYDPETFFAESPAAIEAAKQICGPCPLVAECLEGALRRREPHGVWGGQLFHNGEVIARKRPRGRPPKNPRPENPRPENPRPEPAIRPELDRPELDVTPAPRPSVVRAA